MKWINVKQEKPMHQRDVLVTDQLHTWIGDFNYLRNKGAGGWAVVYNGAPPVDSEDITHWMELPHPINGYSK